jgi:hypothetical protein
VDYRDLLKKYMAHVIDIKATDFITMGRTTSSIALSSAEREELSRISEEAEMDAVVARAAPGARPLLYEDGSSA